MHYSEEERQTDLMLQLFVSLMAAVTALAVSKPVTVPVEASSVLSENE